LYVGVNAYTNSNLANDLLLANVEALTQGEFYGQMCHPKATPNNLGVRDRVCRDGNYSCIEEMINHPINPYELVCL
jgi:hypothetical protein